MHTFHWKRLKERLPTTLVVCRHYSDATLAFTIDNLVTGTTNNNYFIL